MSFPPIRSIVCGQAILSNGATLLVLLLQTVGSQPVDPATASALKLLRVAHLTSPSFCPEFLTRGGVDRLGSALAKAKRDPVRGDLAILDVLDTLKKFSLHSATVEYFNNRKSPAVYSIVRSLANAKVEAGSAKAEQAAVARVVLDFVGLDVRSLTEVRQAQQKKQQQHLSPSKHSTAVPVSPFVRTTSASAHTLAPPPSYSSKQLSSSNSSTNSISSSSSSAIELPLGVQEVSEFCDIGPCFLSVSPPDFNSVYKYTPAPLLSLIVASSCGMAANPG